MRILRNPWGARTTALAAVVVVFASVAGGASGSSLPDGRGYELVSPPAKNGADVMVFSDQVRSAENGDAISFGSLDGFSDVRGTGVETEYMAVRDGRPGTPGWTTHGITPRQQPLTLLANAFSAADPHYVGDLSSDLSAGVFQAWSPLTDAPNVENVLNLYVRKNLTTPGAGGYELVTDCPACNSPFPPTAMLAFFGGGPPVYAGASDDFRHVIFESALQLTSDATPGQPNLYEWDNGTVRLAGILPDSACGSPPCAAPSSIAGQGGARLSRHAISRDGSRIIFTVPDSSDPTRGALYMRIDHTSTVQLNASERDTPDPNSAPARYWDASSDDSRVFFTTREALTNDAPLNGDTKLYMYDVQADALGHHLTFLSKDNEPSDDPSTADDVDGAIGASADGHYVYFALSGEGQLVAGAPTGHIPGAEDRLYLWHDGVLSYIGALPDIDDVNLNLQFGGWLTEHDQARVTPDGRHLLFGASLGTGLTGYDHGSCPVDNLTLNGKCRELYVYSADTHTLVCASCNPSGAPATANAQDFARDRTGNASQTSHLSHALSDDGRFVFFSTQEALVPADTNGRFDAYEYDTQTGRVHLLSSGTSTDNSYFADASANGQDAFILTRDRLVGWDVDSNYDLYDARIGGGFPEPPATPPACSGDSCHGPASASPAAGAVGSQVFRGAGNVRAVAHHRARRCKRGFVRRRVHGRLRCVRRHHRHRAHRASQSRQGGAR